jgi:hypothetical protein
MTEDSKTGMSWIWVLFVIIVIWAVFGGGNFGNFGNRGGNYADYAVPMMLNANNNGCNRVSNCEIERREIIDSATTQYQIEQQGAATRTAVADGIAEITAQNNRIYIQNLQTEAFDLKMENQALKTQIYSDAKFNALSNQLESCCCSFQRRLDGIESQMLTKPVLSGVAATTYGQLVPSNVFGWGWNNCNCNGNI